MQLFLKRIRSSLSVPVRFFAVGEYGDLTWRPHYHLSLFGTGIESASLVQKCWDKGFTYTSEFNQTTAQYVAGYVVKKMTSEDDPRLGYRHPEFARMSLRPGIGHGAITQLSTMLSRFATDHMQDVPHFLKMGTEQSIPLGRYLRKKLREAQGFTPEYTQALKDGFNVQRTQEMRALLEAELLRDRSVSIRQAFQKSVLGRIRQIEAREKIQHQSRSTV